LMGSPFFMSFFSFENERFTEKSALTFEVRYCRFQYLCVFFPIKLIFVSFPHLKQHNQKYGIIYDTDLLLMCIIAPNLNE